MEPNANYKHKSSFIEELSYIFDEELILKEATFKLNSDVDFLWSNYVKKLLDQYKSNPKDIYENLSLKKEITLYIVLSSELPSDISQHADSYNPVEILIGFFPFNNQYRPKEKRIYLTLNKNAIIALGKEGIQNLNYYKKQYPYIQQEFEEESIKSTIAHELSHWLSDSIHNQNLKKLLSKLNKKYKNSSKSFPEIEFQFTMWHEIDANIHTIKQLKRNYSQKEWNKLSFNDLLNMKPSFGVMKKLINQLKPEQIQNFKKLFFGRLARENLLGDNMKPEDINI